MSKKYKVEQYGQFLGHWCAHTPEEAITKAINKYGIYYDIDPKGAFDVTYGRKEFHITGKE